MTLFNGHIWNALFVFTPVGAGLFVYTKWTLKSDFYIFDPKRNGGPEMSDAGDFEPHAKRYQELAKFGITLSAAAIAFLISTLSKPDALSSSIGERLAEVVPIVIGFFGTAITALLAFMILQTTWYEEYLHARKHDTYTGTKYAVSATCGYGGLISMAVGFAWSAVNLF